MYFFVLVHLFVFSAIYAHKCEGFSGRLVSGVGWFWAKQGSFNIILAAAFYKLHTEDLLIDKD